MKHSLLIALLILCYAAYAKKDTTQNEKLKLAMDLVKYDFKTNKINHFSKIYGKKNVFNGYVKWDNEEDVTLVKELLRNDLELTFLDTIYINNTNIYYKKWVKNEEKIFKKKKKVLVRYTIPIELFGDLGFYGFIKIKSVIGLKREYAENREFCIYLYRYGEWINKICLNDFMF